MSAGHTGELDLDAIEGDFKEHLTGAHYIPALVAEVRRLRAQVEYLTSLGDKILTVHEQVVMDTPDDRALHDKACETFRRGFTLLPLVK